MFSLFKDVSIRQRLKAIIMAASAISVFLSMLTVSFIGFYSLRRDITNELTVSASIIGERNTAALLFGDNGLAETNMRVFSVKPSISIACLYDKGGNIFASYISDATPGAVCPSALGGEAAVMGKNTLEVTHVIMRGNDRIGSIYIVSDLRQIVQYIRKQGVIAMWVTSAVLVVSYLLAAWLERSISAPILSLAATARDVAVNKDYTVRAQPFGQGEAGGRNELVLLTEAFNTMLTEIGEREARLTRQNVELERARDAAETASRSKSQFLANMSHELRTPLNAIIGFSSILMNQLFGQLGDSKYMEYVKDINTSGTHLLEVINDILDLAKAEAGILTLQYDEVQLHRAVSKCVAMLAERAEEGGIAVTVDVAKNLPPLMADRLRLMQIILNVLSNAIKFTEQGGKVHIAAETQMAGNDVSAFVLTIRDTGIGMTQEGIEKAFQSFGQVDSGLNRKYEGTGLGLSLTRKLVELHHGTIALDSEPGVGTTATIVIPAFPPEGLPVQEIYNEGLRDAS